MDAVSKAIIVNGEGLPKFRSIYDLCSTVELEATTTVRRSLKRDLRHMWTVFRGIAGWKQLNHFRPSFSDLKRYTLYHGLME
jgi:hypothetical protein